MLKEEVPVCCVENGLEHRISYRRPGKMTCWWHVSGWSEGRVAVNRLESGDIVCRTWLILSSKKGRTESL